MALAQRIVETVFALKDRFTPQSKKVEQAYDDISKSAGGAEKRVEKSSEKISAGFSTIANRAAGLLGGAAAGGVAIQQFSQFVDEVARLGRVSDQLGTTTEELSKLQFAAGQLGIQSDQLNDTLRELLVRVSEAAQGSGEAAEAVQELGLSAEALNQLTVDQQLRAVADALQQVSNQGDKARLQNQLFGESAEGLIRLLDEGSAGLDRYADELERLGGVVTTEAANAAIKLEEAIGRLNANLSSFAQTIGPPVINGLNNLFEVAGFGARTLENVSVELREAQNQLKALQDTSARGRGFGFGSEQEIADAEERIEILQREIRAIEDAEIRRSELQADALARQASNAEEEAAIQKERTNVAREEERKRAAAVRANNAELQQARRATIAIEKEFQQLIDETRAGRQAEDDTARTLLDLTGPISKAQQALAAGDFDRAVEQSRAAADVLRELQEEGNYADIVLTGMAQKIRDLAVEASKAEENQIQVKLQPQSVEQLRADIEALQQDLEITVPVNFVRDDSALFLESEKRGARI